MAMAMHEHVPTLHSVYFVGKRNLNEIERRCLYEFFERFGEIRKLFISKDGNFGIVSFDSYSAAREAIKKANNIPPHYFKLSHQDHRKDSKNNRHKRTNSYTSSDMSEVIEAGRTVLYDIFGNPVDVFEDDNGERYIPYHQLAKAGYKLYNKANIQKRLENDDQIINEFNAYMLTKARNFMLKTDLILKENIIEETINRCRQKIFNNTEDNKHVINSNNDININNLKFTLKQNNIAAENSSEHKERKLRHPHETPSNMEQKKFTTVSLNENNFEKVLITHVEGPNCCYVTPFSNIKHRNGVMNEIKNYVITGKKADPYKHLIYACHYEDSWYRAKITRKDNEIEAFLIDDGRKVIINSGYTLPKEALDIPAQTVLITIKNQEVVLEKGNALEVKPIQKLDNGYVVEVKPQATLAETKTTSQISPAVVEKQKPQTKELQKITLNKIKETSRKIKVSKSKQQKINIPTRNCLIDNLSSKGLLGYTKTIDSETFVAYLLSEDNADELALLEKIKDSCVVDTNYKPNVGDLVAVEKNDEEDQCWVRGLICEIKGNTYQCALIDYGVMQTCHEVRKLSESFTNIPDFSCICKVNDSEILKNITAETDNILYTVKEKGILELVCNDETFIVNASSWNPIQVVEEQKTYKSLPSTAVLCDGDALKVKGVDEKASVLLCQTKQCYERLKEIIAYIKTIIPETLVYPPKVNQLVLSPFGDDEELFRGVVQQVDDNEAEIYFLDYGNSDKIPIEQLRNVDDKLASYEPALLESPKFWYLVEKKLTEKSVSFLEDNNTRIYLAVNCSTKFDLKASDGTLLSTVLEGLDKVQQNHVKKAQESPSKKTNFTFGDLAEITLPPGNYQCVCILCDDLANGLVTFILANDEVKNSLATLQEKINLFIQTETTPFDADEGDLCIAFADDGWSRGVVVEKNVEGCQVYMVDYGNTAFIEINNIRNITEELIKIPSLALICQLDGISDITVPILKNLQTYIEANQIYDIQVIRKTDSHHLIRIPSVYKQIGI